MNTRAAEPHLRSTRDRCLGALRVRPGIYVGQRAAHLVPGRPVPQLRRPQGSRGHLRLRPGSLCAQYPSTGLCCRVHFALYAVVIALLVSYARAEVALF